MGITEALFANLGVFVSGALMLPYSYFYFFEKFEINHWGSWFHLITIVWIFLEPYTFEMALRYEKKYLLQLSFGLYIIGCALSVFIVIGSLRGATIVYCESGKLEDSCFDGITCAMPFTMKPWKATIYMIGIYTLMPA